MKLIINIYVMFCPSATVITRDDEKLLAIETRIIHTKEIKKIYSKVAK